jgi:hypothetical protein
MTRTARSGLASACPTSRCDERHARKPSAARPSADPGVPTGTAVPRFIRRRIATSDQHSDQREGTHAPSLAQLSPRRSHSPPRLPRPREGSQISPIPGARAPAQARRAGPSRLPGAASLVLAGRARRVLVARIGRPLASVVGRRIGILDGVVTAVLDAALRERNGAAGLSAAHAPRRTTPRRHCAGPDGAAVDGDDELVHVCPHVKGTPTNRYLRPRQIDARAVAGIPPDATVVLDSKASGEDIHELEIDVGKAIVLSRAVGRKRRCGVDAVASPGAARRDQ